MEPTQEAGKARSAASARPRVFLCFTSSEITDLLHFALDSYFDCELLSCASTRELLEALQGGTPGLIVADSAREDFSQIVGATKGAGAKLAVLVHKNQTLAGIEGVDIAGQFKESDLLKGISTSIKEMGAAVKNPALAESNPAYPYFRVGVPLLLRATPLVADIYIRLSELRYVKLFHKGAPFGKEEVDKYHSARKIEHLYVKQTDSAVLTATLSEALEKLLSEVPLPISVSTPVSLATIDTVHSLVNQVGFTPEVQRLVKNNVDLVLREMHASPPLNSILKNMTIDREKYIASHSHLLAEVSCALAIAVKWDSEPNFKKLTMAAILHDMSLSNQKLARIKDLKELSEKREEFTSSDVEEYRSHPRRASVIVSGIKDVPADVDKIILQHHELPMGTGFPDAIQHVHIHPLASLMMVAHDLVDWVIDRPAIDPDVIGFIEAHADKYKAGNFRKILKALYSLQS